MTKKTKQIIHLRNKGLSYNQISKQLNCSKGNISYICKKYIYSNQIMIRRNRQRAYFTNDALAKRKAGFYASWFKKHQIAKEYWLSILKLSKDQFFIYYISGLYDGEGNHNGTGWSIYNSDPEIISAVILFIVSLNTKYNITLTLHKTHNVSNCKKFWDSKGIHIDTIYQRDSRTQKKNNNFRENFGTIRVDICKAMGLREALNTYSYSVNNLKKEVE